MPSNYCGLCKDQKNSPIPFPAGFSITPLSVIIAVMFAAGVTSNAGFLTNTPPAPPECRRYRLLVDARSSMGSRSRRGRGIESGERRGHVERNAVSRASTEWV